MKPSDIFFNTMVTLAFACAVVAMIVASSYKVSAAPQAGKPDSHMTVQEGPDLGHHSYGSVIVTDEVTRRRFLVVFGPSGHGIAVTALDPTPTTSEVK